MTIGATTIGATTIGATTIGNDHRAMSIAQWFSNAKCPISNVK
jgi:hypothetical protein